MHLTLHRRRVIGWIGIALILLNVFAPTLAHAVRGPGVPGVLPQWCSMGVVQVSPDAQASDQASEPASDPAAELASSNLACPFCVSAPAALALPAQLPAALPVLRSTPAPAAATEPLPCEAPDSHEIQARAPPAP
ncbi:DUF2946 family protein [Sphaerotilus mobilis]|uniref:DUF2946 family protein n=1 Tax=Sphaerotilus mobilis TaxID=47994 RepID=A0A4Q7LR53_9BURK|nr:DUF2946 family protein [Sphaerotilus mobilis]RZS56773.1 DUF2946 family protein [Sphaerotilus mobilis]